MVEFALPRNSKVTPGRRHAAPAGAGKVKAFKVYRYDPETGLNPRWDVYEVDTSACGPMVLDVLITSKTPWTRPWPSGVRAGKGSAAPAP